ncbi:MAG: hypothetical protein ACFB2X_14155 [Rivularia sp. (in: cyanobacteria)]
MTQKVIPCSSSQHLPFSHIRFVCLHSASLLIQGSDVGDIETGCKSKDTENCIAQKADTINEVKITPLNTILLGVQKERFILEVLNLERIVIPNLYILYLVNNLVENPDVK